MNVTNHDIVRRIAAERERLGITQCEAAEKAGVTQDYWSRIETGQKRASSLEQLSKLAHAVGLRLDVHLRKLRR